MKAPRRSHVTVLELSRALGIPKRTLRSQILAGRVPAPSVTVGQAHAWTAKAAAAILAARQAAAGPSPEPSAAEAAKGR